MRLLRLLSLLFIAVPLANSIVYAKNWQSNEAPTFPVPNIVERQMNFWIKVFSKYHQHHIVIHDPKVPDIIIDVVDFQKFANTYNQGKPYRYRERQAITQKYIDRYSLAIERIQREGKSALRYGPMEERIYSVYNKNGKDRHRLLHERIELRSQTGLADEFAVAAARAERYLPYIEGIFRKNQVPTDLTRIAFVESMFNEKAVSKVGASGIWQFMPDTARRFMLVNKMFDERNSPLKASTAAAKLLAHNYRRLGSWPLAITAYNHGAGGMRRAVRRMGTHDIGEIIQGYRGPAFGFASRNFYAEFLAARAVYEAYHNKHRRHSDGLLNITKINLKRPISVHQLISYTPLDERTLKRYNGCLDQKLFSRYRYVPLPSDYELIVPRPIYQQVKQAIRNIVTAKQAQRGSRS